LAKKSLTADECAELMPYCTTELQRIVLRAVAKHGSNMQAAKQMRLNRRTIDGHVARIKQLASKQGWAPGYDMTKPVPDGYKLRGTSTLYDADGNKKIQWVKSEADKDRQLQIMREIVEAMKEDIPPATPVTCEVIGHNGDLLNAYILTDYHFGMLGWGEETRDGDWDTQIAEDALVAWITYAVKHSPEAATGVLAEIGDLLHYDGLESITPASGHVLDADTRFQKIVRAVIRALRRVIRFMLEKYQKVILLFAEGNHDPASSVWLRELFSQFYSEEPRIEVLTDPDPYYCIEHGQTSLFFHHGHKKKPSSIDNVFAAKFREVFGRTKYSYAHLGHLHHQELKETNLMIVEQHPTLATKDAYASRGGWLSQRAAPVVTYSKQYGEVGRFTIRPEMLDTTHSS